jgi:Zn2+/Cd2+-exporting ATPase
VRTTALADNSTVARMQRLVEAAQNSRSKTQRLVDSCAKYYTPGMYVCDETNLHAWSLLMALCN